VEPASEDMLPKPPREEDGYSCSPSWVQLARMSLSELKNLQSFSIENQHGKISFLVPSGRSGLDLTQVNLGRDFIIEERGISCYENMPAGEPKPAVASKLNVPSIVTLFRVAPRGGKTPQQQDE